MEYLYSLESYNSSKRNRYRCPECKKNWVYTRYISNATGEYLPYQYGKCDRLNNCGYHSSPKQRMLDFVIEKTSPKYKKEEIKKEYLDKTSYSQKLYRDWDNNHFVDYLCSKLGVKTAEKICKDYCLGTGAEGSTIFPYFDEKGNLVIYKTILYNVLTGKRNRENSNYGKFKYHPKKHPIPLYGIHLIQVYKNRPIAIVESEKTACMMMKYHPYFLWLATGSANMLNPAKLYAIRDREIYLFPDQKQFDYWDKIMGRIKERYIDIDISISRECEIWFENGLIKEGDDIADYYNNKYKFSHSEQRIVKIN